MAKEPVELERLEMSIADNVNTAYVQEHGFGDVDPARFASSIEQIGVTYEFGMAPPAPDDVFTSEYLPAASERMLQ